MFLHEREELAALHQLQGHAEVRGRLPSCVQPWNQVIVGAGEDEPFILDVHFLFHVPGGRSKVPRELVWGYCRGRGFWEKEGRT